MDGPGDILSTYDHVAARFHHDRLTTLFERPALDAAIAAAPGRRVLDLGCGTGIPIAQYLRARGLRVLGVDGAPAMCRLYRLGMIGPVLTRDMRGLALGQRFDLILAWNSFFHLDVRDQRAMMGVFARHARPGAAVLFTSGPRAGVAIGAVGDRPVFHASLAPIDYARALRGAGFMVTWYRAEWPRLHGHTVWLARYCGRGPAY